ncbi:MAG TPA: cytochrome c, partial [Methyloversatilis sp.]
MLLAVRGAIAADNTPPAAAALFDTHCARCHGTDRLGGMGPALFPENLERLRKPEAVRTIAEGRIATQMPGFAATLSPDEIAALADWIYSPVTPAPVWNAREIAASRVQLTDPKTLADRPVFNADPLNL